MYINRKDVYFSFTVGIVVYDTIWLLWLPRLENRERPRSPSKWIVFHLIDRGKKLRVKG